MPKNLRNSAFENHKKTFKSECVHNVKNCINSNHRNKNKLLNSRYKEETKYA